MKGNDVLTIFFTFIFGFIGGFYFFLTGYAPYAQEVKDSIFTQDQETVESLIINGKEYGGCERSGMCSSFQLQHDGSYSYLAGSISAGAIPIQGDLARTIMNQVRQTVKLSVLRDASEPIQASNCASYSDGIDYNYEIVRNGQIYIVDTCQTNLNQYSDLERELNRLWSYIGF